MSKICEFAKEGKTSSLQRIVLSLMNGADYVTSYDNDGLTPLHYGALYNNYQTCLILISLGGNVHQRSMIDGLTPLHLAAGRDHTEMVSLLLACGADPLCRANDGSTPISYANSFYEENRKKERYFEHESTSTSWLLHHYAKIQRDNKRLNMQEIDKIYHITDNINNNNINNNNKNDNYLKQDLRLMRKQITSS